MNVSKFNQQKRLENILRDNNMLKNNKIIKNTNLNKGTQKEIVNILEYFNRNHSLNDIDILPKDFDMNNMEATFGFYHNDF